MSESTTAINQRREMKMDARLHKDGCPANRIERHRATRPPKNGGPPEAVEVTRCIDCGGQVLTPIRGAN